MRNCKLHKAGALLAAMICLACLVSCNKITHNPSDIGGKGGRIGCRVTGVSTKGSTISTDGDGQHGTISESIATVGFVLNAYAEAQWHDNTLAEGVSGSLSNPNPAGKYFRKDVTYSSDPAGWKIADDPKWLNGINMTFWSWNAATETLINDNQIQNVSYVAGTNSDELTFDYTLPASTASAASKVDATNQKDIVIAYNSEKRSFKDDGTIDTANCTGTSSDEKMNIRFYHALSEVLFAVSPDDGKYDKSIKIKSICIKNVYGSGSCEVTGSKLPLNHNTDYDVSQGFVWTYGSDTQTHSFAQDYNADFSGFNFASPQDFLPKPSSETQESQSSWHGGTYSDTSTSPATTRYIYSCNNKFFMIPQTLPSEGTDATMLSVTFDNGGVETTQEQKIGGDTWKPGYYYKYKINYQVTGDEVKFSISLVDWNQIPLDLEF